MKAIWQGTLSFGLVNIPVALYSAITSQTLGFTLLCGTCNQPITYKRWCNHCNKEITWDNVVKGLKLKKDTYFILTKEALHALKPSKTESIDILEFVDPGLIDPLYLDTHYYVAPKKSGEKAFFLFEQALHKTQRVAIGDFVMKDKEHVCVILPYHNGLLLTTLNYAYEIRDMDAIETLKHIPDLKKAELDLAVKLIEQRTEKKFDLTRFKDHFAERLLAVIKKKGKGRKLIEEKSKKITHDKTLTDVLKASLKEPKKRAKSKTKHVIRTKAVK